jgi:hypothetical protein
VQWKRSAQESNQERQPSGTEFSAAALEQPQQLAYAYLAARELSFDADLEGNLRHNLRSLGAVPFGRQRIPIRDLELLVNPAASQNNSGRDGAQVLIDALAELFRSIELARINSYLWDRMLSIPSLFDVDLALMVAAYTSRDETDEANQPLSAIQERLQQRTDRRERVFADEFLKSVMRIRKESGDAPIARRL